MHPKPAASSVKPVPPHETQVVLSSDIVAEYNDYGGGVNPLGYKGHTFTGDGYGYSNSPRSNPPSSFKSKARRATYPVYDFGDDDDEAVLSYASRPSASSSEPEKETQFIGCTALIGEIRPLVAQVALKQLGSSPWLSDTSYLAWRVFLTIAALTAIIVTATEDIKFLAYVQGGALIFSVITQLVFLHRVIWYRRKADDREFVAELHPKFGWDCFLFQGTLHLCLMVGFSLLINRIFLGPDTLAAGSGYVLSISSFFLCAIAVLQFVDVFITAVPFRATHIGLVTIYTMILSVITVWAIGQRRFVITAVMLTGLTSSLSGILLHLLGRVIFIYHHEKRMCSEDAVSLKQASQMEPA